jgi:hypothetical protein
MSDAHLNELARDGYCVLRARLDRSLIEAGRAALWPALLAYVEQHEPNRGPQRYFFPMPFQRPCYSPEFFFDDVLIRHPWALHRGSPNSSATPRALVTVRYARRWYADDSREVNAIPRAVWNTMNDDQRRMMRFPIAES